MSANDYLDEEEPGFFEKYGVAIGVIVAVLVIAGIGLSLYLFAGKASAPKRPTEIAIHLLPPPPPPPPRPPPPPPKTPPPPPQQKMVEQPPIKPQEAKPKENKDPAKPPAAPGPAASGPPSDFGLGGGGGGDGSGLGGGGGSKYGWYASEVVARVSSALRQNEKTRDARLKMQVRIWSDANGRVTRAELAGSSGDSAVDAAIKNEVLTGLQLQEPPPADMPMPIVMLIDEQRPN
jgi:outer membrane biosynthesis protein TonB